MTLDDILRAPRDQTSLLWGTYLYPYACFVPMTPAVPTRPLEILEEVQVDTVPLLVTANGGVMMHAPAEMMADDPGSWDLAEMIKAKDAFVQAANMLICELALSGVVSQPATHAHVGAGVRIGKYAVIRSGSGGREMYSHRTIDVVGHLLNGGWLRYPTHPPELLTKACELKTSSLLAAVSPTLPRLVAGAYSLFSQHLYAEALVDAWVVIEQILDVYWKERGQRLHPSSARRERLKDVGFVAAVRIEILQSEGALPNDLAESLHKARRLRNELAHRATVDYPRAQQVINAMADTMRHYTGVPVQPPSAAQFV